jgi:murein DD-endopeptidase MepM/ murein hydrolase activator NlpD
LLVREGDAVDAQQIIALSGASGRTKGAHLHYELRIDGEATDPRRLLKAGEKLGLVQTSASRPREAAQ